MATPTQDVTRVSKRATLQPEDIELPSQHPLLSHYGRKRLVTYMLIAAVVGVLIAGFWNFRAVDGFGRDIVAGNTIGESGELATTFGQGNGLGFGFLFALIIGMAATFTACNCVVFAMIPGMTCSTSKADSRKGVLRTMGVMIAGVTLVSVVYGAYIGFLGPAGVEAINTRAVRLAQAITVFSAIGVFMLAWGAVEFGFLDKYVQRLSPLTRAFFAQPTVKAGIMGVLIGLFAVGRPFGPFHDFLTYAAQANNPLYGAAVLAVQGIGQILLMLAILLAVVYFAGDRVARWVREKPLQPALITAVALVGGGAYFVFYWGLSFMFDIGRWGFKLGLWT